MSSEVATNEVTRRLFSVLSQQLLEYSFKKQGSAARFIRNGGDARSERISIQFARYDDRVGIVPAFGMRNEQKDVLEAIEPTQYLTSGGSLPPGAEPGPWWCFGCYKLPTDIGNQSSGPTYEK